MLLQSKALVAIIVGGCSPALHPSIPVPSSHQATEQVLWREHEGRGSELNAPTGFLKTSGPQARRSHLPASLLRETTALNQPLEIRGHPELQVETSQRAAEA